jgi:preprotein translocase subunit SecB
MADEQQRQVLIRRLYLRSLSLQTDEDRQSLDAAVEAEKQLNIRSTNTALDGNRVEVVLNVGVRTVAGDRTIYRIEAAQAGLFEIAGYTPAERTQILGHICPEILFPYARSIINATARKGGFADVDLRALDFREQFIRNMRERAAQESAS